jgi:hypothetical protein
MFTSKEANESARLDRMIPMGTIWRLDGSRDTLAKLGPASFAA